MGPELTLYIILTTFLTGMVSGMSVAEDGSQTGFAWINPIYIYRHVPVNWFGCIFLTILASLAAGPVWFIVYWVYKLCTIGRHTINKL